MTLTNVSVPPERHELSISNLNCQFDGQSAFCRESQLKERIRTKGFDRKSGTDTVTVCWRPRAVLLGYSRQLVGSRLNKGLTSYEVAARYLHAWLISITPIILPVLLSCTMNCQYAPHYTPATTTWLVSIYRRTVSYWLVADRIGMLVVIAVDVQLQYFMLCTISVHLSCSPLVVLFIVLTV